MKSNYFKKLRHLRFKCFRKNSTEKTKSNQISHDDSLTYLQFISILKKEASFWKIISFILMSIICLKIIIFSAAYMFSGSKNGVSSTYSMDSFIARIKIDGVITTDDTREKKLKEIAGNNSIKAVIVEVNSPGGTITGSEILYNNIEEIRKNKPVVAVIKDVGASGAYLSSLAADHIISYRTSIVGSIGVLFESYDFTELSKKIGVSSRKFKSSDYKSAPDPFEKLSPQVKGYMDALIADGMSYFKSIVSARRSLTGTKLENVANGKIFTGQQAISLGLIDEIGNESVAIKFLQEKKNISTNLEVRDVSLIEEEESFSITDIIIDKILNGKKHKEQSASLLAIWDI